MHFILFPFSIQTVFCVSLSCVLLSVCACVLWIELNVLHFFRQIFKKPDLRNQLFNKETLNTDSWLASVKYWGVVSRVILVVKVRKNKVALSVTHLNVVGCFFPIRSGGQGVLYFYASINNLKFKLSWLNGKHY